MLTADRLRAILSYDAETGEFTWRTRDDVRGNWNTMYAGTCAGTLEANGYLAIRIGDKRYGAHRLAWLYMHGNWPQEHIDHINCCRSDNRISNLREATRKQNQANMRTSKRNSSGTKGVSWNKREKKWAAYVGSKQIGMFKSLDDAIAARIAAAENAYGDFARMA